MTLPAGNTPPDSESLSFDKTEGATGTAGPGAAQAHTSGSCAACQQPLAGAYWASADKTLCSACAEQVKRHNGSKPGFKGFMKAGAAGTLAAIVGWGIYYAVSLTGYEFGLIAIVVGFLVGYAVKVGSGGYGGLLYQLQAVVLTYCAIAGTYTPMVVKSFLESEAEDLGAATPTAEAAPEGTASAGVPPESPPSRRPEPTVFHYVFGFVFALAVPFLSGLENFMGLIILAIGLWEAWKINKRVPIDLSGPFPIAAPEPV